MPVIDFTENNLRDFLLMKITKFPIKLDSNNDN